MLNGFLSELNAPAESYVSGFQILIVRVDATIYEPFVLGYHLLRRP